MFLPLLLLITAADLSWQWPVTTAHGVTASFGEYRGVRFHMGLDFSTGGVEGEKVQAAMPGTVFKIQANRTGFGRVIYISHASGHISVYAHLARFGPALEAYIKENHPDPLAWFGTLEPGLAVDSQQTLAWTGESGAGLPHFHFEVRDRDNRPIDPLSLPFPALPDLDLPALLKGVSLLPLEAESRVNGGTLPFTVRGVPKKIQASGRIGLQILAYAQGSRGSKTGLRGIKITQDGQQVGQWLPRHLDFAFNGNAGLVFDQALSGLGPTVYSYCFDERNQWLPTVEGYQQDKLIQVSENTTLTIELMNMAGNWRSYKLELGPDLPELPESNQLTFPLQATSLNMDVFKDRVYFSGEHLEGTLQLPTQLTGVAPGETTLYITPGDMAAGSVFWRTRSGNLQRGLGILPSKARFSYTLEEWTLTGKKAVLPTQAVMTGPADHKLQSDSLEYLSSVLWFGNPGVPSPGLWVTFDTSTLQEPAFAALYSWSFNRRKWQYLEGQDANGQLVAELRNPTPLVVARDISPPVIERPRRHNYFTGTQVVIPVRDKGTGIDPDSIEVEGPNGILSGDYDSDRGWIILPRGTTSGPWRVKVSDRAGHLVEQKNLTI